MTPINTVLDRLDNPRQYGQGWRCKCPAHDGKTDSNLSIRETSDGKVLIKCFSDCSAADVMHSIGLELADLFPRPIEKPLTPEARSNIREWKRRKQWKAAFDFLPEEVWIIRLGVQDWHDGRQMNEADLARFEQACERFNSATRTLK